MINRIKKSPILWAGFKSILTLEPIEYDMKDESKNTNR
jgi:hypothetical protein